MANDAIPFASVRGNCLAARGIAGLAGERLSHRIARLKLRDIDRHHHAGQDHQPNISAVMLAYHDLALCASRLCSSSDAPSGGLRLSSKGMRNVPSFSANTPTTQKA